MDELEMDGLLAVKLFGWKDQDGRLLPPGFFIPRGTTPAAMRPPKYSSDQLEAQKVWDKMVELSGEKYDRFLGEIPNLVAQKVKQGTRIRHPGELISPRDICVAALKALGLYK